MITWEQVIQHRLDEVRQQGRERNSVPIRSASQPVVECDGKRLLNFASNNYLGLAGHPAIIEGERQGALHGAGATASRLVIGYTEETQSLEKEMALYKGTESALLFPSGYAANIGTLSALLHRGSTVFSDRLNHASIVDGIRLSGARSYRYKHNDMNHLEHLLKKSASRGETQRLIVTDAVFSMDGDQAPLRDLVTLKKQYGAALIIDDAHGGGVLGPQGKGTAHHHGVAEEVDVHMGTFSKAFGVYGAYIAGQHTWMRYLENKSRSLIYTTHLPPALIGGIHASLNEVKQSDSLRKHVLSLSNRFRLRLQQAGLDTGHSNTPIIPLIVGKDQLALRYSQRLAEQGILSVAIRPPTVPDGKARLRFTLMASHSDAQVEEACIKIIDMGRTLGVI